MKPAHILLLAFSQSFPFLAQAQLPSQLIQSIPPPPVGVRANAMGSSSAMEGTYAVLGCSVDTSTTPDPDYSQVKVFHATTGALLHVLNNPNPTSSTGFGYSVAISGSRLVVGAPWQPQAGGAFGHVYVYDLASGTPTTPTHTLANPNPAQGESFGEAVAISGTKIVVGAGEHDVGDGMAYVYDLAGGTPTSPIHTLFNPTQTGDEFFGRAVALTGNTMVIAVPEHFNTVTNVEPGEVLVYDLASGTPTTPVLTLPNPSPTADDSFGIDVAISGTRVVVGTSFDDAGAIDAGSAYVFDLSTGTPTVPVATLANPSPAISDQFGVSVSIDGTRVVVGAVNDDTGASNAGSAYAYDLAGATPTTPVATFNNPVPAANDEFGYALSIVGTRVLVGERGDDVPSQGVGRGHIYDLSSGTPSTPVLSLSHVSPGVQDQFGRAIAISGTRMIVGAPTVRYPSPMGGAFVYDLANLASPQINLTSPTLSLNDTFGASVAISGTRAAVGAPLDNSGAGSVQVYDLASGTPATPVLSLTSPHGGNFGKALALEGSRLVVGAPTSAVAAPTGGGNTGSVYVYDLAAATPSIPIHAFHGTVSGGNLGDAVALSGDKVVAQGGFTTPFLENNAQVFDLAALSSQASIGINFKGDRAGANPGSDLLSTEIAGVAPQRNWNNLGPAATQTTPQPLVDSNGAATPVTVTWASTAIWSLYAAPHPTAPESKLMNGYLDETDANDGTTVYSSVNVTGIPYANYDVIAYFNADGPGRTGAARLNGSSATEVFLRTAGTINPIVHRRATATTVGASATATYVLWRGLTSPNLTLEWKRISFNVGLAGLQIGRWPDPAITVNDASGEEQGFGDSLALSGNTLAVGYPTRGEEVPVGGTYRAAVGRAYVFDLAGATPTVPSLTLFNPDPSAGDNFGSGVGVLGTRVVVGAKWAEVGAIDAGATYVYHTAGGTPGTPVATLDNPNPTLADEFGASLAFDGSRLLIGSPGEDLADLNKGYAYVYGSPYLAWINGFGVVGNNEAPNISATNDGIANLLKYGSNLSPLLSTPPDLPPGSGTSGTPNLQTLTIGSQQVLRFEFLRRINGGLSYTPQRATSPAGPWLPLSSVGVVTGIDATWERVIHDEILTGPDAQRHFGRVLVSFAP